MRLLERLIQKVSAQSLGFHAATPTFDTKGFQALEFHAVTRTFDTKGFTSCWISMPLARLILKDFPSLENHATSTFDTKAFTWRQYTRWRTYLHQKGFGVAAIPAKSVSFSYKAFTFSLNLHFIYLPLKQNISHILYVYNIHSQQLANYIAN